MDTELFIVDQTLERMNDRFTNASFDHLDWFNGWNRYALPGGLPGRWMPTAITEPGIFLAL